MKLVKRALLFVCCLPAEVAVTFPAWLYARARGREWNPSREARTEFEAGCLFGAAMTLASPLLYPLIGTWFPFILWAASAPMISFCIKGVGWLRGAGLRTPLDDVAYRAVQEFEQQRRGR